MRIGGNDYTLQELAGAFGDLGTLIPFLVGYITITGMDPVGILVAFGLFKIFVGLYFRSPIPIQPMKAIGTAAISHPGVITPGAVWASGFFTGALWLALGLTGAVTWIARLTSRPIVQGLVLGLGLGFVFAKGRTQRPAEVRTTAPTSVDVLRRVPYFRSLPLAELRDLTRRCATRVLQRGQLVFTEGEPCHGLLVIAEGGVEVRQTSGGGREQVLHTEGPEATLGEVPLFDGGGYVASAAAVAPTRLLFLPRAALLDLCRRPAVALALLASLARRVRRFAELAGDLAFREVTQRVARYLQVATASPGSAVAPGTHFELALTQEQLAARLGTVRELVARALAQLRGAGVIAQRRRRITILDPGRLAALGRGEARL